MCLADQVDSMECGVEGHYAKGGMGISVGVSVGVSVSPVGLEVTEGVAAHP